MRRLLNALFAPWLVTVLVLYVAVSLVALVLEAGGWFEPDYRRILSGMVVSYGACVVCQCLSERRRGKLRGEGCLRPR